MVLRALILAALALAGSGEVAGAEAGTRSSPAPRYRSLVWPPGTAPRWQNGIGQLSFVVELPAGELSDAAARRHVDAVLRLVS